MLKRTRPQPQNFPHTNIIDAIAIIAALLWLGLMLGLGCGADVSVWTALKRGVAGAIFVYFVTFMGLQFAAHVARRIAEENQKTGDESEAARTSEAPERGTPETAKGVE